jgi:hypothetical protein
MGYSLCARFKTEKEQEAMYQFYRSNTDIIEALSAAESRNDAEQFSDLHFDERLSYSPKVKHLLGYDGHSGRPYYFELLVAWMSVKSTYRDKSNEPFVYYDSEKIKITHKNGLLIQVDERGIQSFDSSLAIQKENRSLSSKLFTVENFEEYAKKVEDLFTVLEERWHKFQWQQTTEATKKPKL